MQVEFNPEYSSFVCFIFKGIVYHDLIELEFLEHQIKMVSSSSYSIYVLHNLLTIKLSCNVFNIFFFICVIYIYIYI